MSPIKKRRNVSNHQEMKHRRRKSNIPELVYKFFIANEVLDDDKRRIVNKCRSCDQGKHSDVVDPISTIGKSIGYRVRQRWREDIGRISKLHNVKQCPISKNQPISYLQKCMDSKSITKEAKKYMKKALNFGVESGYLIPSDPAYRILRVSSDLMKSDSRRNKISICDMILSNCKNRDILTKLEDFQKQKRRQRRQERCRRDQRSRSASRTRYKSRRKKRSRSRSGRRKRYSSPQNNEEITDNEADDYEINEDDPKSNIHTDDIDNEPKTIRSNQLDEEQSTKKVEEDSSDLSIDKNETEDKNEKKNIEITKS